MRRNEIVRMNLTNGTSVHLSLRPEADGERYSHKLRHSFRIEPHLRLAALLLESREGSTFIDVGANLGAFAAPLSLLTGAKGLAIEADPENLQMLIETIAANNLYEKLEWKHCAIWSESGVVEISGESAYSRVSSSKGSKCLALSLDEVIFGSEREDLSLVKLDIEGAELSALKGAGSALESEYVDWIFEANTASCMDFGHPPNELVRIFIEFGYKTYIIQRNQLIPRDEKDFQEFPICDYLATKRPESELPASFKVEVLSENESLSQFLRALNEMGPKYRDSALSRLREAPAWLREDPMVLSSIQARL